MTFPNLPPSLQPLVKKVQDLSALTHSEDIRTGVARIVLHSKFGGCLLVTLKLPTSHCLQYPTNVSKMRLLSKVLAVLLIKQQDRMVNNQKNEETDKLLVGNRDN